MGGNEISNGSDHETNLKGLAVCLVVVTVVIVIVVIVTAAPQLTRSARHRTHECLSVEVDVVDDERKWTILDKIMQQGAMSPTSTP